MAGEWRETTLGEVIELKRGYDLPRQDRSAGRFPLVSSSGVTDYHLEAKVKGPGVVTGRYGTLGQVFYVEEDFWPLNTTLYVRDFKGNDPRFISYFLRGLDFLAYSDKAAVPGLNRNHLHQANVRIPSDIGEQRAIAHILGTLDNKIELNRRMSETLEALARAIFTSWFVDFDTVRAKAKGQEPGLPRAVADLFPDRLVNSEVGEIPEGWRAVKLGELLSAIETGGRPKGGVKDIATGVPSVGAESIVGLGRFDYSKTKFVPVEFFQAMRKGHVQNEDVLLYKDGGRPGEFEPHVTMVGDGFPFDTFCINEHVYRLRTEPGIPQEYLYFWLSSDGAMDEMRNRGTGVAIPGLNSTAVRELAVLLPDDHTLAAFHREVGHLVWRLFANCNQSRTLVALRDALLPRLISGTLRIKPNDRL